MKPDIEELRKKYIENPPEGMTSRDIRHMSEEELLDMDYFLNDDESGSFLQYQKREHFHALFLSIPALHFPLSHTA